MKSLFRKLILCGCGTVGYWIIRKLPASRFAQMFGAAEVCDRATIQAHNAITCPEYEGHAGRAKAERLAELARARLGEAADIRSQACHVEQVNWGEMMSRVTGEWAGEAIVVMGLDRWNSRLVVAEDLRAHRQATGMAISLIQIGLDKGHAQVAAFGCDPDDPCPACSMAVLPGTEPCVVFGRDHSLRRGNLQEEAGEAADLAWEIIRDFTLNGNPRNSRWMNTKTYLSRAEGQPRYRRHTPLARRNAICPGPHSGRAPLRWDDTLEMLETWKETTP